jgi:hypothetical protein
MQPRPNSVKQQDPISFVEQLPIAYPAYNIRSLSPFSFNKRELEAVEGSKAESYISNKSIMSFTADVSAEARKDVLFSTLLAQLAADKKVADEDKLEEWLKVYNHTLGNVGWVVQATEFSNFETSKSVVEMQNVIIDILKSALGGTAIDIIIKTLDAFKKLSDSDNKVLAFENNTHSLTKGTFLLGVANETNGAVAISTAMFQLTSTNKITRILFIKTEKDKMQLSYATSQYTLSPDIYNMVRQPIIEKLGDRVLEYIAAIDI